VQRIDYELLQCTDIQEEWKSTLQQDTAYQLEDVKAKDKRHVGLKNIV
jgi:hypothetical protein